MKNHLLNEKKHMPDLLKIIMHMLIRKLKQMISG